MNVIDKKKKIKPEWKTFKHKHLEGRKSDCARCKFQNRENSIPKTNFKHKHKGKPLRTVSEITVIRGKYDDCIGWLF